MDEGTRNDNRGSPAEQESFTTPNSNDSDTPDFSWNDVGDFIVKLSQEALRWFMLISRNDRNPITQIELQRKVARVMSPDTPEAKCAEADGLKQEHF